MNPEAVDALRSAIVGEVLLPDHSDYDEARTVYNGAIDRKPSLIVKVRGTADVQAAVRFAVEADLAIAVRGGGHSVAGHGTCDDGMLIDLSLMRAVAVDPEGRRARAQGGALLADLDRECQVYGLATTSGQVSMTGLAGLALNGGMGALQRKLGLTCDNLLAAEVVTATGEVVRASEREHSELFWALRGGGGNFGVVTWFEFALHPIGPTVLAGMVVHTMDGAIELMKFHRDQMGGLPTDLSLDLLFLSTPPLDSVDPELHGFPIAGLFIRWFGDIAEGWKVIRPLQEFGQPVADTTTEMTYVELQTMLDELNPYGNQHYWTGEYLPELTDEVIDVLHGIGDSRPSPYCIVQVIPFDGKPTEIDPDATAFAHRSESWLIHILGQWLDPADSEANIGWVKSWGEALRAHGAGETYLNLVTDDEAIDRVERFWNDARRSRLAETKRIYDPDNRFRFNHNIAPASSVESGVAR